MSHRFYIIAGLILLAVFFHYYNNHHIIQLSRQHTAMMKELNTKTQENKILVSDNNSLKSRKRIQELATAKLGMFFPTSTDHVHYIAMDEESNKFCLIDYIIPSVEALTH
ncbi:MAG: cell division protein FtsL [Candidatus Cloacimonetes bacterium]|nr:cell division protein FtsL [Candidatus Cloacimonadota bacterium]